MANVDDYGFNFDEDEFNRRVPGGGFAGGIDMSGGIQPLPDPQPDPAPPQPAAFNPFGGEEESRTKAALDAFRNEARSRGLAVDQGDKEAYAQMQAGFGSLPELESQISRAQSGQAPSFDGNFSGWFDDPSTKLYEQTAKRQMGQIWDNPDLNSLINIGRRQRDEIRDNPALKQLQDFLQQRFTEFSETPGFSPQEMAVLNTQAFEPIEEQRKAAQDRATQRMAARGFLPSSGVGEIDARNIDRDFDKLRTVANRDLAVRGIDRRDQDLAAAEQIATVLGQTLPQNQRAEEFNLARTLGLTIPQGQRAEELNLANILYGLPRNALMDALAVINGSPGTNQLYQGTDQLARQRYLEQQQEQERWNQIAQLIQGLF